MNYIRELQFNRYSTNLSEEYFSEMVSKGLLIPIAFFQKDISSIGI